MVGTPVTVESASLLEDEDVGHPTYEPESSGLPWADSMRRCGRAVLSWGVRAQFTLYAAAYFLIGTLVYYAAESNLAGNHDASWSLWQVGAIVRRRFVELRAALTVMRGRNI